MDDRGFGYDDDRATVTATPAASATATPTAETPPRVRAAVQRRQRADIQRAGGMGAVLGTARAGVQGAGGELPHRAQLERGFRADLSGIRAHVGGRAGAAAQAIGADAYATGRDVAFQAQPDLWTAAHEVTHVMQQHDGVQLAGGVGRAGDRHEQQADAVADTISQGGTAPAELTAGWSSSGGARPTAVQRHPDAGAVRGNTLSTTGDPRSGALDARSRRRVDERLGALGMDDVGDFQNSSDPAHQALLRQVADANAQEVYDPSHADGIATRERIARQQYAAAMQRYRQEQRAHRDGELETAPEVPEPLQPRLDRARRAHNAGDRDRIVAERTDGDATADDQTIQALANAFPRTIFGRAVQTEAQGFQLFSNIPALRGLNYMRGEINVIGLRAFQGGAVHDNNEEAVHTADNQYDDTFLILWDRDGEHVREFRGTTDPGGPSGNGFRVLADQQWTYGSPAPRGRGAKFERPQYGLPSGADEDARVGRRGGTTGVPEESALPAAHRDRPGRVIRWHNGELRRDTPNRAGRRPGYAILHSGSDGSKNERASAGAQVGGDSVACQVVHGRWFPFFNETLIRANGGDAGRRIQFNYMLIDGRDLVDESGQPIPELTAIMDDAGIPGGGGAAEPAADGDAPAPQADGVADGATRASDAQPSTE